MDNFANLIAAADAEAEEAFFQDEEHELGLIASAINRFYLTRSQLLPNFEDRDFIVDCGPHGWLTGTIRLEYKWL
ncbi:hypothetical protein BS17DRAFT_780856 [Gyrodon lividus]|nr:hypothetical protein BS17DRAFT_780856 [Gyrodon lividus]